MSEQFLSQIMFFAADFAPRGWATCSGQILPINQNQALFALLGTTYGGNGSQTFGLPDLRGRAAQHFDNTLPQGGLAGAETVTLTTNTMPQHNHGATFTPGAASLNASTTSATVAQPLAGAVLGTSNDSVGTAQPRIYAPAGSTPSVAIGGANVAGTIALSPTGAGGAHQNMQPYLVVTALIALQGIFPTRN